MRYAPDHKPRTRDRILAEAQAAFRAEGLGLGVKALMNRVGLTPGGFYAHFRSKTTLVGEACGSALASTTVELLAIAAAAPSGQAVDAVLSHYLSPGHRDHPGEGCVVAALAGELAREEAAARKPAWEAMTRLWDGLAPYMRGADAAARRAQAMAFCTAMAGGLTAARLAPDTATSDAMLMDLRGTLGAVFGPAKS